MFDSDRETKEPTPDIFLFEKTTPLGNHGDAYDNGRLRLQ
jgi:hypothetical protein